MNYKIKITLLSETLIGSGEGYGGNIDSDVIFDDFGLPYIPARRIKGCLRESADEIVQYFPMFNSSMVEKIFGKKGSEQYVTSFSNLHLPDYKDMIPYLSTYFKEYPDTFNKESIIEQYTLMRTQTRIEDGVADDGSLRTIRVIKPSKNLYGFIIMLGNNEIEKQNYINNFKSNFDMKDIKDEVLIIKLENQWFVYCFNDKNNFTELKLKQNDKLVSELNKPEIERSQENIIQELTLKLGFYYFGGTIEAFPVDNNLENLLVLAASNFRYIGSKRNRGYGHITCEIFKDNKKLSIDDIEKRLKENVTA